MSGGDRATRGEAAPNRARSALRLLVVMERGEEREALCRRLADTKFGFSLVPLARLQEAVPYLAAGQADALVGDLRAWRDRSEPGVAGYEEMRWVPFCLLVPPGAEEQAAALLERESTDFILQAGESHRLLPALLRRALERQESSWEEVARIIRHEMNNPLTGVLGNAELILAEATALPEKGRERLHTIIHLAVRLRDVVRDLEARLRGDRARSNGPPPPRAPQPLGLPGEVLR